MSAVEWTANATMSNASGVVTVKKFYRVEANDEELAYAAVKAATPLQLTADSEDLQRDSINVRANGQAGTHWDADVIYTNQPGDNNGGTQNPLLRPPRYSTQATTDSQPYFTAKDGSGQDVQVTNSAGVPFETLPEKLVPRGTVTVNFTQTASPVAWTRAVGNINSNTFTIADGSYDPREMLLVDARYTNEYFGTQEYYEVNLEFAFNGDLWIDFVDDRGTHELIDVTDGDGQVVGRFLSPIRTADGRVVERPYPLDGDGAAKANADDDPAVLEFRPYPEMNFPNL
jgi:hypothetical protein